MSLEWAVDRMVVIGSVTILGAMLCVGAMTAHRSSQVDVSHTHEIVFDVSRAINDIDRLRFVAKQAALQDPALAEGDLERAFALSRSRIRNFQHGELKRSDDPIVQKLVTKTRARFSQLEDIMMDSACDTACRGERLLHESRGLKREVVKLQGRGLIVDARMRDSLSNLNDTTIQRILLSSLAFMAFAGLLAFYMARKNRTLRHQKMRLTESQFRLEEIGQYRAQFLAGMSHEFRTPLNAIKGFSQFVLMLKGELPREQLLGYMADIEKSAIILEDITSTVLDLSKVDAGTFDLYEKDMDLVEALRDVRRQFGYDEASERIILSTPSEVFARCDPTAIKRSVQNVLSNALKFSPETSTVDIRLQTSDAGIAIVVQDRGCGIPSAEMSSVWEVYSRSSYTRDSDKQGSGLGLPIIKALMEAHGGDATLESEADVGTTVTLQLPADRLLDPARKAQQAAA